MSQKDAVYSFATHGEGSPPWDSTRSDRVERVNGNSALSTIQFNVPQLASQTSSTTHEDRGRGYKARKEENSTVV